MILLNIGHKRNDGALDLSSDEIVRAFESLQTTILRRAVFESRTETTTVLEIDPHTTPSPGTLFFLSKLLSQDCIALYNTETRSGRLIGPNAEAWLPFNPEYFLTFDGPAVQHSHV